MRKISVGVIQMHRAPRDLGVAPNDHIKAFLADKLIMAAQGPNLRSDINQWCWNRRNEYLDLIHQDRLQLTNQKINYD